MSRKHLQENANTPKIVTSIARYCVYYHLKRFLKDPSKLSPYLTEDLRDLVKNNLRVRKIWKRKFVRTKENISLWYSQQENKQNIRNYRYVSGSVFSGVLGIEYEEIDLVLPQNAETDWMSFVKENSDGLTKSGQKLLQMAIESYVYSVLGSQARTRWPIVGQGAKSLQTQDIFHVLVKDRIVQDDPAKKYKQHADGHREHERRIKPGHLPRDHFDSVFDNNFEETCGRLQQLLDAGNERHEIRRERRREQGKNYTRRRKSCSTEG